MTALRSVIPLQPRPRGFTLVELLVAMTLALLVIAGIGQIYTAAKRSYDVQTSRMQEVGRYAVDLLSQDIRRAGYWGLTNMRATVPTGTFVAPNGNCPTGNTNWGSMVTRRVFGLDGGTGGYACISNAATNGGDVLALRYADPNQVPPAGPPGGWDNSLYINTAPFQAILANGAPAGPTFSGSSIHAVMAHAYYVRDVNWRPCGAGTPAVPELGRIFLNTNGQPQAQGLVQGVERLEFEYGLDTDPPQNDLDAAGNPRRSVNQYVNAGAGVNWNNVVSVRFWVLVRDECPDPSYTNNNTYTMGNNLPFTPADNYRRQLYTSTVALRN